MFRQFSNLHCQNILSLPFGREIFNTDDIALHKHQCSVSDWIACCPFLNFFVEAKQLLEYNLSIELLCGVKSQMLQDHKGNLRIQRDINNLFLSTNVSNAK